MLVILLSNRRRVDNQSRVCQRRGGGLFDSRDIAKAACQLRRPLETAGDDHDVRRRPLLGGSKNGCCGASASQQNDTRSACLASNQRPRGGIETADVGVVAVQEAGREPERIHGPNSRRDVDELVATGVYRSLVRDRDIARCLDILQLP